MISAIHHLPLFVMTVFLLNITPGPDTAYIVGRSVAQGRAAGVVSALGISAGCCVHTLASAFGLTAILAASATAFTVIKLVGAAYLVYLGVRLLWGTRRGAASTMDAAEAPAHGSAPAGMRSVSPLRVLFWQGFWTNVLNPKVVLFFLSFLPQFVRADSGPQMPAFLVLGLIMIAMSTVWNSFVAWIAGSVTRGMGRRPAVRRWLNRLVGSAFIGLGVKLVMTRR